MNYTRDDYRELYNDRDNTPLSDISTGQKICMVVLIAAIFSTGFVEHETVSVMQETESKPLLCPRYDADGRELRSSMVMESYVKNAMKKHECEYQYRSRG